jgi:hypothetical protein
VEWNACWEEMISWIFISFRFLASIANASKFYAEVEMSGAVSEKPSPDDRRIFLAIHVDRLSLTCVCMCVCFRSVFTYCLHMIPEE